MDTTTAFSSVLAALIISALGLGLVVAAITAAIKYPVYWLFGLVVLVLAVSCSKADDLRFEVSVVMDDASDRAAIDEAVSSAAHIMRTQLGVELVATYYDTSRVAEHTKAEALLDALKVFRTDSPTHRTADATVMFTRRELTRGYEGIATIGPACSASASAIVRLRADGLDGQIAAHELLHTVGVPHDHGAGWLMSESLARTGADTLSPDSVRTFMAAPSDCMAKIEPRAVAQSGGGEPLTGGGGAIDWQFMLMLLGLGVVVFLQDRRSAALQTQHTEQEAEIAKLHAELVECKPTEFVLRDITRVETLDVPAGVERRVSVRFTTYAACVDFRKWLDAQISAARRARP